MFRTASGSTTSSSVLLKKGFSSVTGVASILETDNSAPLKAICSAKLIPSSIPRLSKPITFVSPSGSSMVTSARRALPSILMASSIAAFFASLSFSGTVTHFLLFALAPFCFCSSLTACISASA